MTNRRKARRYDLSLPAVVNSNAGKDVQQGRTRDISTRGVLLLLPHTVQNDSEFDVTIELPTEAGVCVRAVVKVVRTEEWAERGRRVVGVGTMIRRYEIVRSASGSTVRPNHGAWFNPTKRALH